MQCNATQCSNRDKCLASKWTLALNWSPLALLVGNAPSYEKYVASNQPWKGNDFSVAVKTPDNKCTSNYAVKMLGIKWIMGVIRERSHVEPLSQGCNSSDPPPVNNWKVRTILSLSCIFVSSRTFELKVPIFVWSKSNKMLWPNLTKFWARREGYELENPW